MNSYFSIPPEKDRDIKTSEQGLIPVQEPLDNTNEGSEFLDDAIRKVDQPLMYTKKNLAGYPEDLSSWV